MVEADAASASSLRAAFDGAYGVFGMTPVVVVPANGGSLGPIEQELALGVRTQKPFCYECARLQSLPA